MDFVTQFHDTLFDDTDDKTKPDCSVNGIYIPKTCPSEWFYEDGDDESEDASRLKFRADRFYIQGKYEKAIENYAKVIPLLESTNATVKRDSLEGMIRAAIKLTDLTRADLWIDELMKMAKSSMQMCSVWKIKAELYFLKQNFKDEIIMWKLVLKQHPLCYEYWLKLGNAYANFYHIPLENLNSEDANNHYNAILLVTSCFIRCRILLETVENNHRHFNFDTKQEMIDRINKDIESFSLPTIFLNTAHEHMNGDIRKVEDERPDIEDLLKIGKNTTNDETKNENEEFDKVWFSWIVQFQK